VVADGAGELPAPPEGSFAFSRQDDAVRRREVQMSARGMIDI
jgi:hypothetical protein